MHLIVFPFILFAVVGIPILLVWPKRGFSGRNYLLLLSSSMFGLFIGFVLVGVSSNIFGWMGPEILILAIMPALTVFLAILLFGNEGQFIAKKTSVLYLSPVCVFLCALLSITIASIFTIAISLIVFGSEAFEEIVVGATVAVPLTGFWLYILSGFIENSSLSKAFTGLAFYGGVSFLLTLALGPYFLILIPLPLYMGSVAFLFPFFIAMLYKPNKYSQQDAANDAAPLL